MTTFATSLPFPPLPLSNLAEWQGLGTPRLSSLTGPSDIGVEPTACAACATLKAFDHQRTISLLEEAVLSNMVLRRERDELQAGLKLLQHDSQLREDFASMAAHELRTPLNTLSLQTQMRRRAGSGDAFSVERNEAMVQRDERTIGNMVRLIDDMRDAASMQRGATTINPHSMDLALMVRRVVDGFGSQAAAACCDLSFSTPGSLVGKWDEFRLEQVLGNLITNAIRYGAGKPIRVELELLCGDAILSIADKGRGIALADLGRVFERFERVGDVKTAPGLGLGLYISDQIVRGHGGSIHVESLLCLGSTFRVVLPV